MGILTISISDKTEDALRRMAYKIYGVKKGSISRALEEAITLWINSKEKTIFSNKRFYAKKGKDIVAQATSLQELATKLNELHISPHDVLIFSDEKEPEKDRELGLKIVVREKK